MSKLRGLAYHREIRNRHIKRKKTIVLKKDGSDWYRFDGQYSKGKIHCGCGICKYDKSRGYETLRTKRELEKFKIDLDDYSNSK